MNYYDEMLGFATLVTPVNGAYSYDIGRYIIRVTTIKKIDFHTVHRAPTRHK